MKFGSLVLLCCCLALPLHAAKKSAVPSVGSGPIIERSATLPGGVPLQITVYILGDRASANAKIDAAISEMRKLAPLFDTNTPNSEISQINANAGKGAIQVSPEVVRLMELAKNVNDWTHGAFDITQTGQGRKVKVDTKHNTVLLKDVGIKITLDEVLYGYLADLTTQNLYNSGIQNLMVQVGGVSRSIGQSAVGPWRIDIADNNGTFAQRAISLSFSGLSVATVGMGHDQPTVDPRNNNILLPQMKGIALLAQDAATAQAIANAMFVLGPNGAASLANELQGMKYVILDNKGNMLKSPGL